MPLRSIFVATSLLVLAACGSSRPAERGEELPTPATPTVDHSDYETFDVAAYPDDAPTTGAQADSLVHDVPAALMRNRPVEAGGSGVVYSGVGYRVQVFQSTDKSEADAAVNRAVGWWNRSVQQYSLNRTPEVYTVYRAPYYRVRVGNFRTRGDAQRLQTALSSQFDGAFIVQDRVTVRR